MSRATWGTSNWVAPDSDWSITNQVSYEAPAGASDYEKALAEAERIAAEEVPRAAEIGARAAAYREAVRRLSEQSTYSPELQKQLATEYQRLEEGRDGGLRPYLGEVGAVVGTLLGGPGVGTGLGSTLGTYAETGSGSEALNVGLDSGLKSFLADAAGGWLSDKLSGAGDGIELSGLNLPELDIDLGGLEDALKAAGGTLAGIKDRFPDLDLNLPDIDMSNDGSYWENLKNEGGDFWDALTDVSGPNLGGLSDLVSQLGGLIPNIDAPDFSGLFEGLNLPGVDLGGLFEGFNMPDFDFGGMFEGFNVDAPDVNLSGLFEGFNMPDFDFGGFWEGFEAPTYEAPTFDINLGDMFGGVGSALAQLPGAISSGFGALKDEFGNLLDQKWGDQVALEELRNQNQLGLMAQKQNWVQDLLGEYSDYRNRDERESAHLAAADARRAARTSAEQEALGSNARSLEAVLQSIGQQEGLLKDYSQQGMGRFNQRYDQALAPLTQAGTGAISQLSALAGLGGPEAAQAAMANFQTSPGYQFRLDQGEKAIRRLNNAQGRYGSGSMYKDLLNYGQGQASSEYGNYLGQLNNLASMYPTQGLLGQANIGLDQTNRLGSQLADLAGLRGDRRASSYMTEGAIKGATDIDLGDIEASRHLRPERRDVTSSILSLFT